MIDFLVILEQPFDQARDVNRAYGHAVATESHERSIVRTASKIIEGLEPRGSLRDLIESEIALQAQLHSYFFAFLIAALGLARVHRQASFAAECFFAVLADVLFSLIVRAHVDVA